MTLVNVSKRSAILFQPQLFYLIYLATVNEINDEYRQDEIIPTESSLSLSLSLSLSFIYYLSYDESV